MDLSKNLTHQDYARLRATHPDLWSRADFCAFITLGNFFGSERKEIRDQWYANYQDFFAGRKALSKKYGQRRILLSFLDALFSGTKRSKKKWLLFKHSGIQSIILESREKYDVALMVEGKKDRLFAWQHGISYLNMNGWEEYVFSYLDDGNAEHLYMMVQNIEDSLKKYQPSYIVLTTDAFPLERAIIIAAKKLGIPTLEYQHGIYHPNFFPLSHGNAADVLLVWGQHFKDMYVKSGIRKSEEVYILGYPFPLPKKEAKPKKPYAVCYLGEDYDRYDMSLRDDKIKVVNEIAAFCKKIGLSFIYRPHPGENRQMLVNRLRGVEMTQPKASLEDAFSTGDIFISSASTSLIQAAMQKKVALQMCHYSVEIDNYEQMRIASKSFHEMKPLEEYLLFLAHQPSLEPFTVDFNNDYIDTRQHPTTRFLEIIEEITIKNHGIKK